MFASIFVLGSQFAVGFAKTLSKTVLVDSPHLVDFFLDFLVSELAGNVGGAESPKQDIPRVQFKHR